MSTCEWFISFHLERSGSTGGSQRRAWPDDTGHCPGPTSLTRSAGPRGPGCPAPPPGSWPSSPPDWGHRPRTQSAASGQSWGPGTSGWCTHCRYLKHQSPRLKIQSSIKHAYLTENIVRKMWQMTHFWKEHFLIMYFIGKVGKVWTSFVWRQQ